MASYTNMMAAFIAGFTGPLRGPVNRRDPEGQRRRAGEAAWVKHSAEVVENGGEFPAAEPTSAISFVNTPHHINNDRFEGRCPIASRVGDMKYPGAVAAASVSADEGLEHSVIVEIDGRRVIIAAIEAFRCGLRAAS